MSGWIKFEKDLRSDIRVARMARALEQRGVCNGGALQSVTVVLGGLAQLWMHADSFARDDDTLEIRADEIDQLTGIQGFSEILPADWLQVLDSECVKLPGFQAHNGSEAKSIAQGTKRVERHRKRGSNGGALQGAQTCNGGALPPRPDQTIPDQTRPYTERAAEIAKILPVNGKTNGHAHDWTDTPPALSAKRPPAKAAAPSSESETDIRAHIERLKGLYPEGGRKDWLSAEHSVRVLWGGGLSWEELEDVVVRYGKNCAASGRVPMNPAQFFSARDEPWLQSWKLPGKVKAEPEPFKRKTADELQAEEDRKHAQH